MSGFDQSSYASTGDGDGLTSRASDAVDSAKQVAVQKAGEVAEGARSGLRDQLAHRSNQAGEQANDLGTSLRSFADQLRQDGKEPHAKVAEQAADRVGQLGRYLSESDPDRLLADLERLGRQQPWVLALGGLTAGVLAGRLLKASARRRYATSGSSGTAGYAGNAPTWSGTTGSAGAGGPMTSGSW